MSKSLIQTSFVITLLLVAASSARAAGPPTAANTTMGPTLVDSRGMSLYTFDKDASGKSACNGKCAENWPPLIADAGATLPPGYTIVKRDDGSSQWAYKGKPLYGWTKDKKPGDISGDGVNNSWHIARP